MCKMRVEGREMCGLVACACMTRGGGGGGVDSLLIERTDESEGRGC
jgi:hypothetical protein